MQNYTRIINALHAPEQLKKKLYLLGIHEGSKVEITKYTLTSPYIIRSNEQELAIDATMIALIEFSTPLD